MTEESVSSGWQDAFAEKSAQRFGDGFSDDVTLDASVLVEPVVGRDAVQATMGAASAIYDSLTFTDQASDGPSTYLQWEATAFGSEVKGVTILTRDERGSIAGIAIHHRPLGAVLAFSTELGRRLDGVVDGRHFYRGISA